MLVNRHNLAGLNTAFNTIFNAAFSAVTPSWNRVAMEVPSSTAENAYPWLGQMKGMREWIGDRTIGNLKQYGFKIVNKTFENTVGVKREHIEDDQIGIYTPLFQDLGQTAAENPDNLVWTLLKSGFTETCYDGQNFFDTDHPVILADGTEGTVANRQAGGAGEPWFLLDTTRAFKPLIYQQRRKAQFIAKDKLDDDNVFMKNEFLYGVDCRENAGFGLWQLAYGSLQALTTENFNTVYAAMTSMKGDHGRHLRLRPMLLVHGPSNREAALEITKAERRANGETNVNRGIVEPFLEPLLAA